MSLTWLSLPPDLQGAPLPIYGNYGGPRHSGGEIIEPGESPDFTVEPIDPLDELFLAHDQVYYNPEATSEDRAEADIDLIQGILALPDDAVTGRGDVYAGVALLALLYQVSVVNERPDLLSGLDIAAVANQAGDLIAQGSNELAPQELARVTSWLKTATDPDHAGDSSDVSPIGEKVKELAASLDTKELPAVDHVLTDEAFDFVASATRTDVEEAVGILADLGMSGAVETIEAVLNDDALASYIADPALEDLPADFRALSSKLAAIGSHSDFFA